MYALIAIIQKHAANTFRISTIFLDKFILNHLQKVGHFDVQVLSGAQRSSQEIGSCEFLFSRGKGSLQPRTHTDSHWCRKHFLSTQCAQRFYHSMLQHLSASRFRWTGIAHFAGNRRHCLPCPMKNLQVGLISNQAFWLCIWNQSQSLSHRFQDGCAYKPVHLSSHNAGNAGKDHRIG